MKPMRYLLVAFVLASALSMSTFAGNIHTGIEPQPTPTPVGSSGVMSTPGDGTIHTGVAGDMHTGEATAEGVLAEAVVDLVQGVLALL